MPLYSMRDLEAGLSCGCRVVLVKTGKGEETTRKYARQLSDIPVYENLSDFDKFNDDYISLLPVKKDAGFVCYHSTRTFNPTIA